MNLQITSPSVEELHSAAEAKVRRALVAPTATPFNSVLDFMTLVEENALPYAEATAAISDRLLITPPAIRLKLRTFLGMPRRPTMLDIPENLFYLGLDRGGRTRAPSALSNARGAADREAVQFLTRARKYIESSQLPDLADDDAPPSHPDAWRIGVANNVHICAPFKVNSALQEQLPYLRGPVLRRLHPGVTQVKIRQMIDEHDEDLLAERHARRA